MWNLPDLLAINALLIALMMIDTLHDFREISKGIKINYLLHGIGVLVFALLILTIGYYSGIPIRMLLASAVMYPGIRWFIHDYGLNHLRHLPAHYVGTRSRTDKIIRFGREALGIPGFFVRFIGLLICFSVAVNVISL